MRPDETRGFRTGDEEVLCRLQEVAFAGLEYLPRVRADLSEWFDPSGFFAGERDGVTTGCIGVLPLPRANWYEIRYLALNDARSDSKLGEILVERAVRHAESRSCEYLKALTIAVPPYVDTYERFGFTPVRRTLRISWDIGREAEPERNETRSKIRELTQDDANELADGFARGHLPYWDWWIEERGGERRAGDWLRTLRIDPGAWVGSTDGGSITAVAGFAPNSYGPGIARLREFCVLPEFRGRGVGSAILRETLRRAAALRQQKLVVYTLGFGDSLAPGAIAYIESGGKIEAEYMQLLRA